VQDPLPLYYVTLAVSLGVFVVLRGLATTPFGLTLQGRARRAGPACARSAFDVTRHRMLGVRPGGARSRPSPGCLSVCTTAASRRARSTWRRRSTS
jgi:hypothetical protein